VSLAVQAQNGCRDTIDTLIQVIPLDSYLLEDTVALCNQDTIVLNLQINNAHDFIWSPEESLSDAFLQQPLAFPTENTTYQVQIFTTRPSGVVCLQEDSIHVLTDWPIPTWLNTTEPIQCDSIIRLSIDTDNNNEVAWSINSNFIPAFSANTTTSILQSEEQAFYYLSVRNTYCQETERIEVFQQGIFLNFEDVTNCFGDSSFLITEINSTIESYSIDWTIKESVKAKLKIEVKKTLRQFGYPPNMKELATETVLKQAELIANELVM